MFKTPMSRFAEDHDDNAKKNSGSKISKSTPTDHDDITKSVTVNQHHDGSYSVSDGENAPSMHEGLDDAMQQAHSLHDSLQNPAEGGDADEQDSLGMGTMSGSKGKPSVSPRKGAMKPGKEHITRNV